jgi:NAD(P)-dependent dehydrogenase (short-subunit alcohol dehydrogenase family)
MRSSATPFSADQWALILGGSSGFGLASAKKLATCGMSVAVVHRDRRGAMAPIEQEFAAIRAGGSELLTFNLDALSDAGRATVLDALTERMAGRGRVRLVLHSIALGNLKLLAPIPAGLSPAERARASLAAQLGIAEERLATAIEAAAAESDALADLVPMPRYDADSPLLEDEDLARTVYAMGTSLATWVQDVRVRGLFASDARVLGLTSEGNEVASNVLQPGVTDTPAVRVIPGSARAKAAARRRNPFGRLTTPEDVADVVCLLCTDEARWINGAIIRVDGGEHIAG